MWSAKIVKYGKEVPKTLNNIINLRKIFNILRIYRDMNLQLPLKTHIK